MGIFGDIAEGIGDILGQAGPILAGGLAERIARSGGGGPTPIIIQGGGGVGVPTPSPLISAGGVLPTLPIQTAGLGPMLTQQSTGGGLLGGAYEDLLSLFSGGNGVTHEGLYESRQTTRPVPRIMERNPVHPERIDVWEYAGRPVLYSRDLRACRRVSKLARRARGRRGGR